MFEELCRKDGIIKIPTGYTATGDKAYQDLATSYFAITSESRSSDSIQLTTSFYCKLNSDITIPGDSQFQDNDNNTYDITGVQVIFNHFDNILEFVKLTVKQL